MTFNLPPSAARRLRRQGDSHVAGSLLSVPALAALASVSLVPVGEVMGCTVVHLAPVRNGCAGAATSMVSVGDFTYAASPVVFGDASGSRGGPGLTMYARALELSYETVLGRLRAEASALGADGIVGLDLQWRAVDGGACELMALGTAVRYRDRPITSRSEDGGEPFVTQFSGQDVASSVSAGWTPVGLAIGLSVAVKHVDALQEWQTSRSVVLGLNGNMEVEGLTELAHAARSHARQKLTEHAGRFPEATQVALSDGSLRLGERRCTVREGRDTLAEAAFVGTALRHVPAAIRSRRRESLSIMPLGSGAVFDALSKSGDRTDLESG